MELVDYLRVLRRRWALLVLAAVVCTAGATFYSLRQTPLYSASTRLVVSGSSSISANDEVARRQLAVERAGAFAQFANTLPAVDAALAGAGFAMGVDRPSVEAGADGVSPFITITVTHRLPDKAARVANAYARTLPGVITRLDRAPSAIPAELSVLEPAGVPSTPSRPKPPRDIGVGLALGLILGVGSAFLREALDRSFKDPDQIEDTTGLTVLGVVPQELPGVDLPSVSHPQSSRAEAYRTVRTNIQFAGPAHTLKTIVITSATAGEGKTTIAANLAIAFARTGQRVVIVDADMRRSRLLRAFGMAEAGVGLSELLVGRATLNGALRYLEDGQLAVLPSGALPSNPSELLGSQQMAELLRELGERFDVVLVDSPPVLPVTDPLVLSVHATGVVLVVQLGDTSRERLRRALGSLRKLDVPLLGIVANGALASGDAAYAYGDRYGYSPSKGRSAAKR